MCIYIYIYIYVYIYIYIVSNAQRNARQKVDSNYIIGSTPLTPLAIIILMKDSMSKRLLKRHVRRKSFRRKIAFRDSYKWSRNILTYLDIITENDITDLQNKLLTLNLNEMELFFFQNIIHKLFTEVKFLKTWKIRIQKE